MHLPYPDDFRVSDNFQFQFYYYSTKSTCKFATSLKFGRKNFNAFTLVVAAMSLRISSFASVKNERVEEDDEEIAVIPNPREIRPQSPAPPRDFLRIFVLS